MIKGLHHNAYRCRDSEETRQVLRGLPRPAARRHASRSSETKSGRKTDTLHTFYRLDDGSYLAFFEAPDMPFEFKPQHDFDLHIALEVEQPVLEPMLAKGKARRHRDPRHLRPRLHRLDLLPRSERLRDRADRQGARARRGDGSGDQRSARHPGRLGAGKGACRRLTPLIARRHPRSRPARRPAEHRARAADRAEARMDPRRVGGRAARDRGRLVRPGAPAAAARRHRGAGRLREDAAGPLRLGARAEPQGRRARDRKRRRPDARAALGEPRAQPRQPAQDAGRRRRRKSRASAPRATPPARAACSKSASAPRSAARSRAASSRRKCCD